MKREPIVSTLGRCRIKGMACATRKVTSVTTPMAPNPVIAARNSGLLRSARTSSFPVPSIIFMETICCPSLPTMGAIRDTPSTTEVPPTVASAVVTTVRGTYPSAPMVWTTSPQRAPAPHVRRRSAPSCRTAPMVRKAGSSMRMTVSPSDCCPSERPPPPDGDLAPALRGRLDHALELRDASGGGARWRRRGASRRRPTAAAAPR